MDSCQITSARQTWISSNNIFKDALNSEIDNHADTHCFGKNCRRLSLSDLMFSVSPFLSRYTNTDNVEICTAATAWTIHTGQVYILVFVQGIWFGDRMDRSLINPNQCCSFGIYFCDDPTDPHMPLGFQTNTLNIPLFMEGIIATMSTLCPYLEELESFQYIYLYDQESWDPSNVSFKIMSMEEESRHSISSRSIFGIAMPSISLALCKDTLTVSLVSAVSVCDIKPAHKPVIPDTSLPTPNIAAITHERHQNLTPKYLAQKWNIGLNTSKKTINVTTQLGVRSALGPLT